MTRDAGVSAQQWSEAFSGKVALVSGAGRGQGRSHALALAAAGASLALLDGPAPMPWLPYEAGDASDLAATAAMVNQLGGAAVARNGDIRDRAILDQLVADAVDAFGRLDFVVANAGVVHTAKPFWQIPPDEWRDVIDVNLTGTWNTISAAVPAMIAGGVGGSIVVTSSAAALRGASGISAYVAAKSGLHGLMASMSRELARFGIRVNVVAPTTVDTPMVMQPSYLRTFRTDLDDVGREDVAPMFQRMHLLAKPWVEARDVTNSVLFLLSEMAGALTGHVLPVDLGASLK